MFKFSLQIEPDQLIFYKENKEVICYNPIRITELDDINARMYLEEALDEEIESDFVNFVKEEVKRHIGG